MSRFHVLLSTPVLQLSTGKLNPTDSQKGKECFEKIHQDELSGGGSVG